MMMRVIKTREEVCIRDGFICSCVTHKDHVMRWYGRSICKCIQCVKDDDAL